MAVPKKKTTKSKRDQRRSQDKIVVPTGQCWRCKKAVLPHRVCGYCGYYGRKQVLEIKTKAKTPKKKES